MLPGEVRAATEDVCDFPGRLAPGHAQRLALYQLYHVLNHLNLFGSGYLPRALALIRALA